jgi:hypothetical protein
MPVDWTVGISAPDFPYPSRWNPTTLAGRDWRLRPKVAWNQGMLGYLALIGRYASLPNGKFEGRLVVSLFANILDHSPPTMLSSTSR